MVIADVPQDGHPVDVWHPHVADDDVEAGGGELGDGCFAAQGKVHVPDLALWAQHPGEPIEEALLVVDEENVWHGVNWPWEGPRSRGRGWNDAVAGGSRRWCRG